MATESKSGSQSGSQSSSGGKSSAQQKTDTALKDERSSGDEGVETTDEGVAYPTSQAPPPKQETLDKVTYRDPRPLDWPQKADRSVFIGPVRSTDADDDRDEKSGYVYAGQVREDEELEVGGTEVKDAQVVAGGGHLNLIINGETYNLGGLGGSIQGDIAKGLETNANS
jgi:hypothetical protein